MPRIRPTCLAAMAGLALAACEPAGTPAPTPAPGQAEPAPPREAPVAVGIPAGTYRLDPSHASLVFTVNHLGFTDYTGTFSRFDATLELDPEAPEAASLVATIDVASLVIPAPPEGFLAELTGPDWLNAEAFPEMTYQSTQVEPTGDDTAVVTGNLTLNGTTAPVRLDVTFNGGYPGFAELDPFARIGFSATGQLNRSDFGIAYGIPPEGSEMGVSDAVEIIIEAEFSGPPLNRPAEETER